MANAQRSEMEIELGGVKYTMRPNFQALAEIEQATNTRLLPLVRRVSMADIGILDAAHIIHFGIKGAGGSLPIDKIGACLAEEGLSTYVGLIVEFLSRGLSGNKKQVGNEDETET